MSSQQLFKLIFLHDQRLDELAERGAGIKENSTLEDFLRPDPTYSKLYFTGTDMRTEKFGLSVLNSYERIVSVLENGLQPCQFFTASQKFNSLSDAISSLEIGDVIVAGNDESVIQEIPKLQLDENSNVGHIKSELKSMLQKDDVIIFKEKSHDGFDLHMFSKNNIYTNFFYGLQKMVPDHMRFFSINGKRVRSERFFYFETWTLNQPPHGFEEVFPESVL